VVSLKIWLIWNCTIGTSGSFLGLCAYRALQSRDLLTSIEKNGENADILCGTQAYHQQHCKQMYQISIYSQQLPAPYRYPHNAVGKKKILRQTKLQHDARDGTEMSDPKECSRLGLSRLLNRINPVSDLVSNWRVIHLLLNPDCPEESGLEGYIRTINICLSIYQVRP
jgi:hypothetical protein